MFSVEISSNIEDVKFKFSEVFPEANALACGVGYLNHQEPYTNGTVCYGSSGQTANFIVYSYQDCRDMLDSCCSMPEDAAECPSIGG